MTGRTTTASTPSRTESEEALCGPDCGLLSPVRAGTPAEAATSDTAWLQAMLDAEAALARAQAAVGAVPTEAAAAVTRADRLDVRALALVARETANPVVGMVRAFTRAVAEESPDAAAYVHHGSTSQDIFDTGAMLVATRVLRLIHADLERAAAYAVETGLARPPLPWHALRTPVADLAAALALTAGALGKIAVDVQSLARTEVGEVAEPAVEGRGASSAMPHKRNPVLSTLLRSAALQVPVLAAGVTQCLVCEDERSAGVWHAEWQLLRECLRLTGGAAHTAVELAEGLVVRPGRMRANLNLTGSQIVSERICAALAPLLGKARARELLTRASAEADHTGSTLATVLGELPEVTDHLTPNQISRLLDPEEYTGAAALLVDLELGGKPAPRSGQARRTTLTP